MFFAGIFSDQRKHRQLPENINGNSLKSQFGRVSESVMRVENDLLDWSEGKYLHTVDSLIVTFTHTQSHVSQSGFLSRQRVKLNVHTLPLSYLLSSHCVLKHRSSVLVSTHTHSDAISFTTSGTTNEG